MGLTSPPLLPPVPTTCPPTVCPSLPLASTPPDSDSPDLCPTPTVPLSPLSPRMLLLPARSTWLPTPRLKKLSNDCHLRRSHQVCFVGVHNQKCNWDMLTVSEFCSEIILLLYGSNYQ